MFLHGASPSDCDACEHTAHEHTMHMGVVLLQLYSLTVASLMPSAYLHSASCCVLSTSAFVKSAP